MIRYAVFDDNGECLYMLDVKFVPDDPYGCEVPVGSEVADFWRNGGEPERRIFATPEIPDTLEVGDGLDLPPFDQAWWSANDAPVSGRLQPDKVGPIMLKLHGRYRFEKLLQVVTYVEQRREAYPPIADQLDMIYHQGVGTWRNEIAAIKARFPKPTES